MEAIGASHIITAAATAARGWGPCPKVMTCRGAVSCAGCVCVAPLLRHTHPSSCTPARVAIVDRIRIILVVVETSLVHIAL
jgi:hypothetical protein